MFLLKHSAPIFLNILKQNTVTFPVKEIRHMKRWVAPTLRELRRRKDQLGPEPEKPRSSYLEFNYDAELFAFGKRLHEDFNRNLLKRAFIHKEYANLKEIKAIETGDAFEKVHNSDLIEEGDAIIKAYVKEYYSKLYPDDIVDSITEYLTSKDMLAHVGKHMGVTDLIFTTEFPIEPKTVANILKAVIAALKQSQNLSKAQLFVKDFIISQMNGKDVYDIWNPEKPYEYFVNLLKKRGINAIEPRLCNKSGSNTILANYRVGLYSEDKKLLGIGWGENIQTAKETAALDGIKNLYKNYNSS